MMRAGSSSGRGLQTNQRDSMALWDVAAFNVQRSEIFVIIGLSGSGKSTVVRTLNMLQADQRPGVFENNEINQFTREGPAGIPPRQNIDGVSGLWSDEPSPRCAFQECTTVWRSKGMPRVEQERKGERHDRYGRPQRTPGTAQSAACRAACGSRWASPAPWLTTQKCC